MTAPVSMQSQLNQEIPALDDTRRRLGIASLHGKIKACLHLLRYADQICGESDASYVDPTKSEAHLYSCIEGVYTALAEVSDHSQVGMSLCTKIVGDKDVQPLERFAVSMRAENGLT